MTGNDIAALISNCSFWVFITWEAAAVIKLIWREFLNDQMLQICIAIRSELTPFIPGVAVAQFLAQIYQAPFSKDGGAALLLVINAAAWWAFRHDNDDDDRWKRRRKRLTTAVREAGGKLILIPAGGPA